MLYDSDLLARITRGVGEATVRLPSEVGIRVEARGGLDQITAEGLQKQGDSYVNDAYGDSEVTLDIHIQGWVGHINLQVA